MKVRCLECDAEIAVPEDVIIGEIVSCPDCGMAFEVFEIQGDKVKIRAAEVEGEDWGE